jgi:hypothetical protein
MAATAAKLIEVEVTGTVMPGTKEVSGGVGAKTQQWATTTMDNTHNNQTECGTGWRKTAAVNNYELGKCEDMMVDAVGGIATTREGRGQS